MAVIENFNELSESELLQFAKELVQKINAENIFSSIVNFTVSAVEADEMTGDLLIEISHGDLLDVPRAATWTCSDEDEVYSDPGSEAEYQESIFKDVESTFTTLKATVDGYAVELSVDDADDEETIEVEVDSYTNEDAGIGYYEYGGVDGYDSDPYIEVEGTIIRACSCVLSLNVTPAN